MKSKLASYRKKRDFKKTKEPFGRKSNKKHVFVVQKHRATHLHYDLRLEISKVLASWAIPKKPSKDPKIKRLAIETEDHPLEYASFEGEIPKGEYGAGRVLIWDRGTYENLLDISMKKAKQQGKLEVFFKGKKLKGAYVLIRINENKWLFFKIKDK